MDRLSFRRLVSKLLESPDPADDSLFQQVVYSMLKLGFSQEELANGLRVSKSEVSKWSRGRNLPYKLVRQGIYAHLLSRLESIIDSEIIVLQEVLRDPNPTDDNFKLYLSQCLYLEFVSEEVVARQFEESVKTVRQWAKGTAKPYPFLSPHIFKWLLEEVDKVDQSRHASNGI